MAGVFIEGPFYLPSRQVLGMEDPAPLVTAFTTQIVATATAAFVSGEFHSPSNKLLDPLRTFLHDETDHVFLTKIGPAIEGVLNVGGKAVFLVLNGGDAALGVVGVLFEFALFCHHGHRPQLCRLDGETEAGDAAAQDKKVSLSLHDAHRLKRYLQHCEISI